MLCLGRCAPGALHCIPLADFFSVSLTEACFLADHITVPIDCRQEQRGDKHVVYRRPVSEAVARFLGNAK